MTADDSRAVPDTETVREALEWFRTSPHVLERIEDSITGRHAATIVRAALARDVPTPGLDDAERPPWARAAYEAAVRAVQSERRSEPYEVTMLLAEIDRLSRLARDVPAGRDLTERDVHSAIRSAAGGAEVFAQDVADHLNRIARGGQR